MFYFLYQLFQYLKAPDEFQEVEDAKKLRIFSKRSLDMTGFFTRILHELLNNLRTLLKDANVEDRVRDAKLPDDALKPFREKAGLVLLSVANGISRESLRTLIFPEPKKLLAVVKTLKKLSNKVVFQEPYAIYFEKKKLQVMRKLVENVVSIFMDMPLE